MDAEVAQKLREPFPPEMVGKLPKGSTQLDYVGHAAVTDRLLQVDPEWSWEPFALDADGCPVIRERGKDLELWIRLTIAGVTKPGVGTVSASAFDASKQLVSDALRNAAMRFGVALDLWAKEDLHAQAPPPTISGADAERLAAALNNAGPDARRQFVAEFGGPPARLAATRLADADAFIAKLGPRAQPGPEGEEPW